MKVAKKIEWGFWAVVGLLTFLGIMLGTGFLLDCMIERWNLTFPETLGIALTIATVVGLPFATEIGERLGKI